MAHMSVTNTHGLQAACSFFSLVTGKRQFEAAECCVSVEDQQQQHACTWGQVLTRALPFVMDRRLAQQARKSGS